MLGWGFGLGQPYRGTAGPGEVIDWNREHIMTRLSSRQVVVFRALAAQRQMWATASEVRLSLQVAEFSGTTAGVSMTLRSLERLGVIRCLYMRDGIVYTPCGYLDGLSVVMTPDSPRRDGLACWLPF